MKEKRNILVCFTLIMLIMTLFAGCSDSSNHKNEQTPISDSTYPNSGLLVSGESLEASIGKPDTTIIDARSSGYSTSHIPGAISLLWSDYTDEGVNLKPVADLENQLSAAGLNRNMKLVIYDDTTASWGAAGRIFWMLEYLGCTNVHILNGGWDKWVEDGRSAEATINTLPEDTFVADVQEDRLAGKDHILNSLGDEDFVIIDPREDEEYNGWTLYGETRGGHIRGAVSVNYKWFFNSDKTVLSYEDLKDLLESREITTNKEVTSYCTAGIRSGFVYFTLRLMGYEQCSNYDGSMYEWSADASAPMDAMPNYHKLVYPGWVKDLIDGKEVPNPPAGRYVIAAAGYHPPPDPNDSESEADDENDVYIPGSFYLHRDEIELNPRENEFGAGNLWPDDVLKANIENMGIDKNTTVILYHHNPGSPDPIFATRVLWALMYAGVEDVRLINGGIDAWIENGYEVTSLPEDRTPVADFGTGPGEFPLHPEYLATTEYIEEVVNGDHTNAVIADIRSWGEYIGGENDYRDIGIPLDAVGRIPGAMWGHWGPTTLGGGDFWDNVDGTFRSYTEVSGLWTDWAIIPGKTVSFYCGTAWRSTLAFFYAHLMGWENIKNYDGSWFEWAQLHPNADNHPIETGSNPNWPIQTAYPNYDILVDAKWVKETLIDDDNNGHAYVIAEVGWGGPEGSYDLGHIPGAIHVNTDEIEYDLFLSRNDTPADVWLERSTTEEEDAAKGLTADDTLPRNWWNLYPDDYLLPAIAYMGIDKDTTVVVYGTSASAGARLVWALMYAGTEDVRLLNGGYEAWLAAGYEGTTETTARSPVSHFGSDSALHPEYLVDTDYVRNVVQDPESNALIVDIRNYDEYIGATAPYSYIPASGRISGAVWGHNVDDFINSDGTLKTLTEIEEMWREAGITSDKAMSFYCGTAWRSSLAFLFAYMMGWEDISNYDGSWYEWSMGPDADINPVEDDSPDLP